MYSLKFTFCYRSTTNILPVSHSNTIPGARATSLPTAVSHSNTIPGARATSLPTASTSRTHSNTIPGARATSLPTLKTTVSHSNATSLPTASTLRTPVSHSNTISEHLQHHCNELPHSTSATLLSTTSCSTTKYFVSWCDFIM